MLHKRVIF